MAFCSKCGKELEDGAKFCPACGAAVEEGSQDKGSGEQTQKTDFSEKVADLNNTKDTTGEFDKEDIEQNKVMAVLAYIGILFLIPLLAAKDSKYARYHTNQGLVLFIVDIIVSVAASILRFIPFVGWVLGTVCGLLCLVLMILGIVNAATGKAKELPVIGKFVLLK